jgi:hypothetical protein
VKENHTMTDPTIPPVDPEVPPVDPEGGDAADGDEDTDEQAPRPE